jgi:hypothetical protein
VHVLAKGPRSRIVPIAVVAAHTEARHAYPSVTESGDEAQPVKLDQGPLGVHHDGTDVLGVWQAEEPRRLARGAEAVLVDPPDVSPPADRQCRTPKTYSVAAGTTMRMEPAAWKSCTARTKGTPSISGIAQ